MLAYLDRILLDGQETKYKPISGSGQHFFYHGFALSLVVKRFDVNFVIAIFLKKIQQSICESQLGMHALNSRSDRCPVSSLRRTVSPG